MNKKYLFLVLIVVAVLAVLIYKYNYRGEYGATTNTDTSPSMSANPQLPAIPRSGVPVVFSRGIDSNLSYSQAVDKYVNHRIQFDVYCQGIPKAAVFKNNTNVMFDNRSGDARWFSLDGHAYHLDGYGFIVLTLYSAKVPHAIAVDCGSARNVTQITLER